MAMKPPITEAQFNSVILANLKRYLDKKNDLIWYDGQLAYAQSLLDDAEVVWYEAQIVTGWKEVQVTAFLKEWQAVYGKQKRWDLVTRRGIDWVKIPSAGPTSGVWHHRAEYREIGYGSKNRNNVRVEKTWVTMTNDVRRKLTNLQIVRDTKPEKSEFELSIFNAILKRIQDYKNLAAVEFDTDKRDLLTALRVYGLGEQHIPDNLTWASMCAKNDWQLVTGDLTIGSFDNLVNNHLYFYISDKAQYFKNYLPKNPNNAIIARDDLPLANGQTVTRFGNVGQIDGASRAIRQTGQGPYNTWRPYLTTQLEGNNLTLDTSAINIDARSYLALIVILHIARWYCFVREIKIGRWWRNGSGQTGIGWENTAHAMINEDIMKMNFGTPDVNHDHLRRIYNDIKLSTKAAAEIIMTELSARTAYTDDDSASAVSALGNVTIKAGEINIEDGAITAGNKLTTETVNSPIGVSLKRDNRVPKLSQEFTRDAAVRMRALDNKTEVHALTLVLALEKMLSAADVRTAGYTEYDFITCHDSCHSSCHGSRGRR